MRLSYVIPKAETPPNWDEDWFTNLCGRPHKERLAIAGALLAAEIDRQNFLEEYPDK